MTDPIEPDPLPEVVHAPSPRTPLAAWAAEHRAWLRARLLHAGAVLLRGFVVAEPAGELARLARAVTGPLLPYIYRSTPRTEIASGVYSATEYPARATIPQHNENAYCEDWPMILAFLCARAAPVGGETPLARTAGVTRRIPSVVRDRFRALGVRYVRNYREGMDLPWQVVFQTSERAEVERFCAAHDMTYTWGADGTLRTEQVCQAMATHPVTGEELWFNQAHLFHVTSLDAISQTAVMALLEAGAYPRHACYGDGSAIDPEALEAIRAAFAAETVAAPWATGDALLVDNMLVSHGRRPFSGPRKVLVAMAEPFSSLGTGRVFPARGAA
jgi:alpha-ketoglutarate-dependent taurine dioxygenase